MAKMDEDANYIKIVNINTKEGKNLSHNEVKALSPLYCDIYCTLYLVRQNQSPSSRTRIPYNTQGHMHGFQYHHVTAFNRIQYYNTRVS